MANPTVNVPPAELIKSFILRALKSHYAEHPMLVVLKPPLMAAVARLDLHIGGAEKGTAHGEARAKARDADGLFDANNRFAVLLLEALAAHPEPSISQSANYLLTHLFPERLAVTQRAFELQAASGEVFAKRLAQPQAQASLATLTREVPRLGEHLQAIVSAAQALGTALEALDGVYVDKAGRPVDPELFKARTEAHRLFARFVDVVETFAYPDSSAEHAQARTALIGPYSRFLTANLGGSTRNEPAGDAGEGGATPVPTP